MKSSSGHDKYKSRGLFPRNETRHVRPRQRERENHFCLCHGSIGFACALLDKIAREANHSLVLPSLGSTDLGMSRCVVVEILGVMMCVCVCMCFCKGYQEGRSEFPL